MRNPLPLVAFGPDSTDRPFIRDAHLAALRAKADAAEARRDWPAAHAAQLEVNDAICQGPYAARTAELARDLCGRLDALHGELQKENAPC